MHIYLLLFATAVLQPNQELIPFQFDPPLGVLVEFSYVQSGVQKLPGETRERVSRSAGVMEYESTEDGWLIRTEILESSMTMNGSLVESPIVTEMVGLELFTKVDADVQLVEVRGYDELWRRLEQHFPPEVMGQLEATLSSEAILNRERAEWAGRYGDFAGAEVEIGDVFEVESEFPLPGGETIVFHTTITIDSWVDCGATRCLRIVTDYTTDSAEMSGAIGEMVPGLEYTSMQNEIEGGGYRIIDPATMNIHEERIERTMRMTVDGTPVVQEEVREYRYEYK
jgi:hypothetical protein